MDIAKIQELVAYLKKEGVARFECNWVRVEFAQEYPEFQPAAVDEDAERAAALYDQSVLWPGGVAPSIKAGGYR